MRFEEVYDRWAEERLTQREAADLLGVCERQFRRQCRHYEAEGSDGLLDLRLGQLSSRRAPVDEVMRLVAQYRAPTWAGRHARVQTAQLGRLPPSSIWRNFKKRFAPKHIDRLPRLGIALAHTPPRIITHVRGKTALQTRPLCVGEAHVAVQPVERLELALQDIVGDRPACGHADQTGIRELRIADGSRRPVVLHAVDDAGVASRGGLVARHFPFMRQAAPVGFDGGKPWSIRLKALRAVAGEGCVPSVWPLLGAHYPPAGPGPRPAPGASQLCDVA
jgi:hypothetical protein